MTHPIRRALRLLLLVAILLPGTAAGQTPPDDPLAGVAQLVFSGKVAEAQTRLRDALQTYEVLDDRQGQALCHILLGISHTAANDPAAARASLELGAGMLEAEGDAFGGWMAFHILGELEKGQGRFDAALASYDHALALVRQAETSTAPFSLEGFKNLAGIFGMPVESFEPLLQQPQVVKPALLRMAELLTRGSRGGALVEAGRLDEAEADLARATTLSRVFGGMLDAPVASHIGDLRRRQGRFDEARESYRKALGGMKSLPDASFKGEWAETHILGQLADIELLSGQPDAALAWNDQALGQVRGNAFREAPLLQDRANLLLRSQRLGEAAETFARALDIARIHKDVYRQATILADLGSLEFFAGHYQKSAEHFETSIQLFRDLRQPSTEGFVWTLLAQTYLALGAHGSARSALDKAQELTKQSGFHFAEALAEFIAAADRHLAGEMSLEALEQSVQTLFQLPEAGGLLLNQDTMAVLREVMGLGGSQKPADPGAIHGLPQVPAMARFHLGKLRLQSGDLTGARELWLQALEGSPNQDMQASLLAAVGMTWLKQGKPDEAIGSFSRAVELIEGSDVKVEELMTSYLGDERRIFHELLVETLVHQGRFPEAFHAAEQARARAFLQQIGNRRLRPAEGGDARLAAEAENLRVQIPVLERQVQLAPPPEQARRASDLALARDRYQALLVRLKVSNTEYSAVTRVETVQVQDLQREIPPETTLISYYVSSLGTRAWVIDRETFQHVSLSLSAADFQRVICRADEIGRRSGTDTVSRGVAVPDARCVAGTATSEELYEKLIAPLRPHIRHPKLVLIPHGPLHYLPFAALRDPESGRYLIEQHTLTYLPSASAFRHLRAKETPVRGRTLVLGDPASAAPDLQPLPAAQKEADLVAKAFTTSPVLGTQATESTLYELGGEVDLLHIAAHGIYEPANPLFSRIALAPGAHHDGNLEVHEILGAVDLKGVNLVVLSACQTAAGERSGGDEIVGLTRAVLYAGSPGVISTLWQIHDTASAVLMEGFYDHLRKGLPAAEALRQAQLSLLAHPLYSQPYYWAAFSLSGDPQGRWEGPHPRPLSHKWERGVGKSRFRKPGAPLTHTPLPLAGEGPGVRAPSGDPLAGMGDLGLIISGKPAEVEPRLREALAAAERAGDLHSQAASHLFLGMATLGQQNIAAAREHFGCGAKLFTAAGDRFGAWIALWMLGELEENEARLDAALIHLDGSLAVLRDSAFTGSSLASFRSFAAVLGVSAQAFDKLGLAPEILGPMMAPFAELISIDSRGGTLVELGRLEEAEAELSRAAETSGLLGGLLDSSVAAHVGDLRRRQGRLEEARENYHKALGGVGTLPSFQRAWTEMGILDRLADIELITGHLDEALALNDRSLGLARSNRNVKRETSILQDRANLLLRGQRFEAAAEVFGRALALARSNSNVYREATILSDLGFLEFTAGRYQKAVEHLEGSVRLFRGLNEPYVEAPVWLILSESYLILGAHESARSALDKAHELAQKSGFRAAGAMADLVGAMERHHSGKGTRDAVDQSFKAVLQVSETRGLLFNEEAATLFDELQSLGEPRTGEVAHPVPDPEALARTGQPYLPDAARFLLGKARFESGDLAGARAVWLQALETNESLNRDLKAGLLGVIGATYIREGKTEEAIPYLSRAVETVDRSDMKVEELMAGYLGGGRHLYSEFLIETLLRQGRTQEAFEAAERARARAFLQQIGNRRLRPTDGGDPRLAQDAEDLRVLIPTLERKALFALPEEKEHRDAGVALALARQRYQALLVRLKVSSSEYSAVTRVETIQIRDLQKEIPPDATLISYFLSPRGVQAWVIDRETFQYVALSLQGDDIGRAVCWADQIGRRGQEDSNGRGVTVPGPHCKAGAATSEEVYEKLIAPLRPHIRHPRLLIVPHGTLHYLPFAAMRDPQSGCYLAEQHTLTYLPSASALRFLRDKETPVEGGVLVFGDPASSRPDLQALPAAEKEADLVAKAFATSPVLGTQATESTLYRLNGSVDLLHIAAHGIYEPANPLFSRIALAPGEEHDGNLEVHEILGAVDLTGVNLVVLSACRTASGRRSGGDEIVGLTRAFLYAGSPGVVSTLWEIDDTASAVLMEDFYRHLREGAPAAEALRQAQLGLLASPLYSDPYYWAAFSLTGDPQGQW